MDQCSECVTEQAQGDRLPEEVNPGDHTCEVCREPVCEVHGKVWNTRSMNGTAHYNCWEV